MSEKNTQAEAPSEREALRDLLYAHHARPSCQEGALGTIRCRCVSCATERASAALATQQAGPFAWYRIADDGSLSIAEVREKPSATYLPSVHDWKPFQTAGEKEAFLDAWTFGQDNAGPQQAGQGEAVYWQWRRKKDAWSTDKIFNTAVFATTSDSEVRALYTTPPAPQQPEALAKQERDSGEQWSIWKLMLDALLNVRMSIRFKSLSPEQQQQIDAAIRSARSSEGVQS